MRIIYIAFFLNLSFSLFAQSDTTLHRSLPDSSKQLAEVVVVGNKPIIEKLPGKIVYRPGNSITAAGSDALQAVSQIPGIHVNNNELSVVGKGMVRVMLNHRLLMLEGEDLTRYLRSLSANEIDRIELITNPSANYEADGNAGLINIITKRSKLQGVSGNIQLSSKLNAPAKSAYDNHTLGELSGSGNLALNWNNWSAYANFFYVQGRFLEGFETDLFYPRQSWYQTDTGLYQHKSYNIITGVDYKIGPKTSIGVSYSGGRELYDGSDHVHNPIYDLTGKLDSTLRTYATYYPVALPNSFNLHADIRLDTTGKQLSFNADYFNYFRTDRSDFESNTYDEAGKLNPERQTRYFDRNKQNINVYTVKVDADLPTAFARFSFGSKISFITNYSNAFYYNKAGDSLIYNTDLSNEFTYTENTQSIYGSMSKDMGKWKLQGGLRGELTQTKGYSFTLDQTTLNHYFRLFPSMLVSYQHGPDNTFALTVGRRINRPTFWSLNPFKSLFTANSYGEGNPYLQPEYTSNFELSHVFKNLLTSSVFLNITDNGFNNVTIASPDTNLVYTIPLNFIKTSRIGLTENLSVKPVSWWENNEQLTFYHTRASSAISNIKDIDGWGFYTASNNTLFFNRSRTLAAAVNFWCQFPEIDHIGRSGTYYKLDLGLKFLTPNRKWDVALNLNDAFRSSASAVSSTINGIPQKFANFQVNRYFQLSLNYKFGNNPNRPGSRSTGNEEEKGRVH